ncbi:MAG: hypothetical protein ACI865_000177 [Flavobacteriaceae bacterium]|jgi:hypothetical protein
MTREDQLEFCSVCTNRSFNPKLGIVCGLTDERATFEGNCKDYIENDRAKVNQDRQVESRKDETTQSINKGRTALFVIGGVYTFLGFYEAFYILYHQLIFGIIDWALAAIFIGLAIWSYQKASLALIIGLIVYVGLIVLLAAVDPTTVFKGIIWKALVIYYLIYSIKTARTEEAKVKLKRADLLDDF